MTDTAVVDAPVEKPVGFVTVDGYELKQALTKLKPALPGRGVMSVLFNVRVAADPVTAGRVWLTVTDLELRVRVALTGDVVVPEPFLVNHAALTKFVSKLTAKTSVPVTITPSGLAETTVTRGRFTTRIDNNSQASDWPAFTDPAHVLSQVRTDVLADAARFSSTDEFRPILCGVLLRGDRVAATDSYRLVELEVPWKLPSNRPDTSIGPDLGLLVSAKAIKVAAKHGDTAVLLRSDREVTFRFDDVEVTSRLIEGEFPNYPGLYPENPMFKLVADRAELVATLKELRPFGADNTPAVFAVSDSGGVTVSIAGDSTSTEAELVSGRFENANGPADAPVEWVLYRTGGVTAVETTGQRLGFNPEYALDMVDGGIPAGDTVTWLFDDAFKPAVIDELLDGDVRRRRLLMPVRVA